MSKRSIETFIDKTRRGTLSTNRHIAYHHILQASADLDTLRARIPMPHQSLTSALSILNDWGVIYQDANGVYHATAANKFEYIAEMREEVRYEKWKKLGERNGWHVRMFAEDMDQPVVGIASNGQTYLL